MTQTPENKLVPQNGPRAFTALVSDGKVRTFTAFVSAGPAFDNRAIRVVDPGDIEAVITLLRDAAELHTLDDDSFEMAEHVNAELAKRKKNIVATAEVPLRALREAAASVRAARDEATGQIDDALAVLSKSILDYTDRKKAEAEAARVAAENRQRQIDEQNAEQERIREPQRERDDDRAEHAARLEIADQIVRAAKAASPAGILTPSDEHLPIVRALIDRGDIWAHPAKAMLFSTDNREEGHFCLPAMLENVEPADLSPLPEDTHPRLVTDDERPVDELAGAITMTAPVNVHVPKSRVHARKNRVLEIDNPEKIPYRATENGEPLMSPNRGPITRALKAGLEVPGCRLVEKRTAVTR